MSTQTIYQYATDLMKYIIEDLLDLADKTHNFTNPPEKIWLNDKASILLLSGKGFHIDQVPAKAQRKDAWLSRAAIPFNLELAATGLLYRDLETFTDELIKEAYQQTDNFTNVSPGWIYENPHFLPVMSHVAGIFSRQKLKNLVGSVSDTKISKPASEKLAAILSALQPEQIPNQTQIRERIKATSEGIVRDLVGRLLLEEFVAMALHSTKVPFLRENEYNALGGVVYDFRADFVIPNEHRPKAFIEVRKSSSRHASLYAKDKMFSAINWKGKHPNCIGVIVVDGPWTANSLEVMSKVFDYVVPIAKATEIATRIREYLEGDKSALKWLIYFRIDRYVPEENGDA